MIMIIINCTHRWCCFSCGCNRRISGDNLPLKLVVCLFYKFLWDFLILYPICFSESDAIMHESGSTGSSSASSSFAEDEGTAGKTWFNPFIVRNDMIQNSVVAKLNKGLFPMESERTSVFTGLYVECANVS